MKDITVCRFLVRFAIVALAALLPTVGEAQAGPLQGFGAGTLGGAAGSVVRVTNRQDSGPGSLREALGQGNRAVVFDVAGEIAPSSFLYVSRDDKASRAATLTLRCWRP